MVGFTVGFGVSVQSTWQQVAVCTGTGLLVMGVADMVALLIAIAVGMLVAGAAVGPPGPIRRAETPREAIRPG
jgi:hypothetical protein